MDRTNWASAFPIRCSVIWRSPNARAKSAGYVASRAIVPTTQLRSCPISIRLWTDRQQHHLLEVAGPLVPEESRALVIADVDERHRAAIGDRTVKSPAERLRVGKCVRLHVARRARCRIVGRQALVIEEHAPQRGAIVAQRVVGWGVVVLPARLRKMRGQLDVRVAIGSGGELEGAPGGGP